MKIYKLLKFFLTGMLFGVILGKAEVISWYRIYEMFSFESFHMYGVIGSACTVGIVGVLIMKAFNVHGLNGKPISFKPKKFSVPRYLIGGTIFGLGWALTGACPGPLFILVGYGYFSIIIVIIGALLGTFLYGILRKRLPH